MDRKHLALGSLFLAGALGAFYWNAQATHAYQAAQPVAPDLTCT